MSARAGCYSGLQERFAWTELVVVMYRFVLLCPKGFHRASLYSHWGLGLQERPIRLRYRVSNYVQLGLQVILQA